MPFLRNRYVAGSAGGGGIQTAFVGPPTLPLAGDTVVVIGYSWAGYNVGPATAPTWTIRDNSGNAWELVAQVFDGSGAIGSADTARSISIWVARNFRIQNNNCDTTVKVTWAGNVANSNMSMIFLDYWFLETYPATGQGSTVAVSSTHPQLAPVSFPINTLVINAWLGYVAGGFNVTAGTPNFTAGGSGGAINEAFYDEWAIRLPSQTLTPQLTVSVAPTNMIGISAVLDATPSPLAQGLTLFGQLPEFAIEHEDL